MADTADPAMVVEFAGRRGLPQMPERLATKRLLVLIRAAGATSHTANQAVRAPMATRWGIRWPLARGAQSRRGIRVRCIRRS